MSVNARSERLVAMDAAVKAVASGSRGSPLPDAALKAVRAFADGEIGAATGPNRESSLFARFVDTLGPTGVTALAASTSFFSVRVNDVAILANKGVAGARELVLGMRCAHDVAVSAVATHWRETVNQVGGAPAETLGRIGKAMASLVGDGAALRGNQQQEAVVRFAEALYPRGGSEDEHAAADMVVARLMALQSRGPGHAPFAEAMDALDFRAAAVRRRPALDRLVEEAIRDDIASTLPAAPATHGLPPRVQPSVREDSKVVRRIWSMDGGAGRSVCGRDPFDGPAATHRNLITGEANQVYYWRGERLGTTRRAAIESLREDFPAAFDACADRFSSEMRSLAATDPAAHAEVVGEFAKEVGETFLATLPEPLLEALRAPVQPGAGPARH